MFSNSSFDYCIVTVYVFKTEEKKIEQKKKGIYRAESFSNVI